jgi:hypothetical protein
MTSNYVAKVVESLYNKLDIDKMSEGFDKIKKYNDCGRITDEWVNTKITDKSFVRWCKSIGVLETHLLMNYENFNETELVYKWGKRICEQRNWEYNQWRTFGGYKTFGEWLKRK